MDEKPIAVVTDGFLSVKADWCYYSEDYPRDGSVGPFNSREEAEKHAYEAGYSVRSAKF